jgi:hypothetical protein
MVVVSASHVCNPYKGGWYHQKPSQHALLGAFIVVGASYSYNACLLKTQPVPAYIAPWILSRPFLLICIEKKIMLEHDQNFSFCVFHIKFFRQNLPHKVRMVR